MVGPLHSCDGVFVELVEGATQTGHYRLRDLVPDTAAAALGTVIVLAFQRGLDLISSRSNGERKQSEL
jgi:hypothetical protein